MDFFDEETSQVLLKFLDRRAEEAEKEIEQKGVLSEKNAIPLILKTQFNHIAHLDRELTAFREMVDKRFEKIDQRFEKMDQRFEKMDQRLEKMDAKIDAKIGKVYTLLAIGFSVITALIIIFQFVG